MSETDSHEMIGAIRDAWEHLRPIIYRYIERNNNPSQKALVEEMVKFDCIVKGNLRGIVSLFREMVEEEQNEHAMTKRLVDRLRKELSDVYTYDHRDISRHSSEDLSLIPSPIEEETINDWGGEYRPSQ